MKVQILKAALVGFVLSVSGLANAALITASGTGANLPDNDPVGILSSVNISDNVIIDNINVTINGLSSTWVGDLIVTLQGPTASADLMFRTGSALGTTVGDGSNLDGDYNFADGGNDFWAIASLLDGGTIITPGTYAPTTLGGSVVSLAGLFQGTSSAGLWSLQVSDNAGLDANSFESWTLNINAHTDVAEPSSLVIFALSLIGLGARRFNKKFK